MTQELELNSKRQFKPMPTDQRSGREDVSILDEAHADSIAKDLSLTLLMCTGNAWPWHLPAPLPENRDSISLQDQLKLLSRESLWWERGGSAEP